MKTGTEIFLGILGGLALGVATFFFRLFVLGKVYTLTIGQHLNGPSLTMWQMFALSWFVALITFDPKIGDDTHKDLKKSIQKTVAVNLGLLISWGLAALIF
jgi:hypothetical protein